MKIFDEKKCAYCQNTFHPSTKRNIYCSKYCKRKGDTSKRTDKPKTKTCNQCKVEFSPYTSISKFCSASCRIENMKSKRTKRWSPEKVEKIKGDKNPAYRHGLRVMTAKVSGIGLRQFFKNRNEYKKDLIDKNGFLCCERCGCTGKLEAHHIIYRSEKPKHQYLHSKDNILLVCVPCHNWFHNKKEHRNDLVEKRKLNLLFGEDVLNK